MEPKSYVVQWQMYKVKKKTLKNSSMCALAEKKCFLFLDKRSLNNQIFITLQTNPNDDFSLWQTKKRDVNKSEILRENS